jgi:xanthine phosphoribosyltransferase
MKLLEERIQKDGKILPGNVIKVDSFLNQQLDVDLLSKCGKEWHDIFGDEGVTKILTVESTGIGIACLTATHFGVPVVYAKKTRGLIDTNEYITSRVVSYTHGTVYDLYCNKDFLTKDDKVLIIDDFMAGGNACNALIDIINQAGAEVVGIGIAIEKGFQPGGKALREKGYKVRSLAIIDSMNDGEISFRCDDC